MNIQNLPLSSAYIPNIFYEPCLGRLTTRNNVIKYSELTISFVKLPTVCSRCIRRQQRDSGIRYGGNLKRGGPEFISGSIELSVSSPTPAVSSSPLLMAF